ncbi:MAG TPA: hypothetical protein VGN17_14935 [Bryobacteraceae bacterium]
MTRFVEIFPACVALALELYLVLLLLRGPFRKYPLFFAYAIAQVLGDSLEAYVYYHYGHDSRIYRTCYWTTEGTSALMLFLVVISFTYEALRGNPLLAKAGRILATIAVLISVSPFVLFHSRIFSYRWFNSTDQMLNFGCAIMNLVLWGALLANRHRDSQLLAISMGLGIVATSSGVVWGARLWVADTNRWPLDTFGVLMKVGALLLWCWVLRPKARRNAPPLAAASLS